MGLTGSTTAALRLDDVPVPADRLVGERGRGMQIALGALDSGRLGHQRGRRRARAVRARRRRRLRRGARGVRAADRRAPGRGLPAGRHGRGGRVGAGHLPGRGPAQGRRQAVLAPGQHRQAGRHRRGDEGDHRRRPGARRRRLHPRPPRRALHARGEGDADLRGHQPDPADGHRQAPGREAAPARGTPIVGGRGQHGRMAAFSDVEAEQPEFAARVRAVFDAHRHKTSPRCARDGAPRISGIEMGLRRRRAWLAGMPGSIKFADLRRDPRMALHSGSAEPDAFTADAKVSGRAVEVPGPASAAAFAEATGTPAEEWTRPVPGRPRAGGARRAERREDGTGDLLLAARHGVDRRPPAPDGPRGTRTSDSGPNPAAAQTEPPHQESRDARAPPRAATPTARRFPPPSATTWPPGG